MFFPGASFLFCLDLVIVLVHSHLGNVGISPEKIGLIKKALGFEFIPEAFLIRLGFLL